jgi:hypothetical protein
MYALRWRRHSGRLHEEVISCARGLVPSIAGSKHIYNSPQYLLSDNAQATNCSGEISNINSKARNSSCATGIVSSGLLSRPPYFQFRAVAGDASYRKAGAIPFSGEFSRFISSGDRDDRGSDERQQTVPLTDGEGDEQDNEKERSLSVKDAEEEVSTDPSTTLSEGFSGGKDDGEEQAEPARAGRSRKVESERERITSEEARAEALFWTQKARFKKEFEKRIVGWDTIHSDLLAFPYYLRSVLGIKIWLLFLLRFSKVSFLVGIPLLPVFVK